MAAKEWSDNETFLFRNNLWTGLGGNYFLWAKTFPGNNNCLCHKSNVQTTNKQNNHLWKILFPALACKVVSSRKSSLTG